MEDGALSDEEPLLDVELVLEEVALVLVVVGEVVVVAVVFAGVLE